MRLSVVIPTINSASKIEHTVQMLTHFLRKQHLERFEIILAAQTSDDSTFEVIKHLASQRVKPLYLKKRGKGIGLTAGIQHAQYENVLLVDDDLPYSLESMERLLKADADVAIASRYVKKMKQNIPLIRKIVSACYIGFVKTLLPIKQHDIQAGMKLLKKSVFERIPYPKETGYVWDTEFLTLANRKHLHIIEVPATCKQKPNQLSMSNAVLPMVWGVLRVWLRYF